MTVKIMMTTMMRTMMNNASLSGRIVTEIWNHRTPTGKSVVDFIIAVPRNYKNKDNSVDSDFIKIKAWNNKAENILKYFSIGKRINISGDVRTDVYDKNGTRIYDTYIKVREFDFVDYKADKNKEIEDREIRRNSKFIRTDEEIPF